MPPMESRKEPPRRSLRRFHHPSLKTMIATLVGLGAIATIAGYLVLSDGESEDQPSPAPAPTRGAACPDLREAYEHSLEGNEVALEASVKAAARAGEAALEKSGTVFGQPEKIALELEYLLAEEPDKFSVSAREYWLHAKEACQRIRRWSNPAD